MNDVAVEALALATGNHQSAAPVKRRDLSDLAGTWVEDPEFDQIMKEQDQIDPRDWQ